MFQSQNEYKIGKYRINFSLKIMITINQLFEAELLYFPSFFEEYKQL